MILTLGCKMIAIVMHFLSTGEMLTSCSLSSLRSRTGRSVRDRAITAYEVNSELLIYFSVSVVIGVTSELSRRYLEDLSTMFLLLSCFYSVSHVFFQKLPMFTETVKLFLNLLNSAIFSTELIIILMIAARATENKFGYLFRLRN